MQSLFDLDQKQIIVNRIQHLTPETKGLWGKMDVAQMLAHLVKVMEVAIDDERPEAPLFNRVFGPLVKSILFNDRPFAKSLPTAPSFKMVDPKEFELEKGKLLKLIDRFQAAGQENLSKHKHPFFGRLSNEQWGTASFKHLDHHLSQFGV